MKKLTITLIITCMAVVAMAQNYTGTVKDTKGEAIPFANIVLLKKQDNKLLSGAVSDINGDFNLKINTVIPFYIEISCLGFEKLKLIPEKNKLGDIVLKRKSTTIEEVAVKARKKLIEQKVDRMIFNLHNSIANSGGNALDALKVTPGVNVQSNALTIIGKQQAKVLINDRIVKLSGEELINYLISIASDDIKRIEVITTPPSKYDAEGDSGLINIVLKKAPKDTWNNQIRMSYTQKTYPSLSLGNSFNYNHNKVKLTASIDAQKGYAKQLTKAKIDYPNEPWEDRLRVKKKQDFVAGRFSFDYELTKNASVGILYSGKFSDYDDSSWGHTNIFDKNDVSKGKITTNGETDKRGQNHSLNAHYIQHLDTLGRKLSMDLDYFNYQNPKDRIFISNRTGDITNYLKTNNVSDQTVNNYSAKLDIEHPFAWGNLSYGAKITSTKTQNSINYYNLSKGNVVFDPTKSDNFEYTENIQALYFDIAKSFGKHWQTKIGLRMENTQTKGVSNTYKKTNKKDYLKLFPTLYVSYVKNRNNIFNFSYSRRIQRPDFWALNPFKWYLNANSYVEGNPFLQPKLSDNLEFKYIYKNRFITKLFASFITDGYGQTIMVNATNKEQVFSQENYYKTRSAL